MPLPKIALQCCREFYVSSNTISQVAFDTNKYSVPTNYEGRKNLLLKAYVNKIEIYDGNISLLLIKGAISEMKRFLIMIITWIYLHTGQGLYHLLGR
ncbi:hypothetical protein [Bacillus sp. ISL-77]|uniref:Mu transposase domain-containing protein n=1 Tax=Bacillus sp. ISL-77 TaxID=2819138 RepID=UPI0035A8311E